MLFIICKIIYFIFLGLFYMDQKVLLNLYISFRSKDENEYLIALSC